MKHVLIPAMAFLAGAGLATYQAGGDAQRLQTAYLQALQQQRQEIAQAANQAVMEPKLVINAKETIARPVGDGSRVVLIETRLPHPELMPRPPKPTHKPTPRAMPTPAASASPASTLPVPAGWRGWLRGLLG